MPTEIADEILSPRSAERALGEQDKAAKLGVRVIDILDPQYPPLLREIFDPPIVLYVSGKNWNPELPQLAIVGTTWATGTVTGNFASDGQSTIRYTVTRSDAVVDGGVVGKLMVVTVTTYSDDNGNNAMDTSEARTVMTTKLAKLASYVTKAGS